MHWVLMGAWAVLRSHKNVNFEILFNRPCMTRHTRHDDLSKQASIPPPSLIRESLKFKFLEFFGLKVRMTTVFVLLPETIQLKMYILMQGKSTQAKNQTGGSHSI